MGNHVSSMWSEDNRFAFHMPLTAEEVKGLWKTEERMSVSERRKRYLCGRNYTVGNIIRPWDIQIIPAIYEMIPHLTKQYQNDIRQERVEELRHEFELSCVKDVRLKNLELTEPNAEYASCRPYVKAIQDNHIISILSLARYHPLRASKYLLNEIVEDLIFSKFKKALVLRVDALPPVPRISLPNVSQINALSHLDCRTQEEALGVFDKVVCVIQKVYNATKVTLSYDEAMRLLRNGGWKVDTAVNFYFKDEKAYKELKPKILKAYHDEDRKMFDPSYARTILRRTNFDQTDAVELYGVEMKRRWAAVEELKTELKDSGIIEFSSNRSLYQHLINCFWDVSLAKDKYDYTSLAAHETAYAADHKLRIETTAKKLASLEEAKLSGNADADATVIESDNEDESINSINENSQIAHEEVKSSSKQLMEKMEAKAALRQVMLEDSRNRDIALLPNNVPCEANTEINKLVSLYQGDIIAVEADAIWNIIPEHLAQTPTGLRIFEAAGGRLMQEYLTLKKLEVGKSFVTRGYNLPARFIIHTVFPAGQEEHLMQDAIDSMLQVVKDMKLRTVVMSSLREATPHFPPFKAVHLAVLTSRLWLDVTSNRRAVDRIIFCAQTENDAFDYKRIMPFYYPGPNMDSEILMQRYTDFKKLYVDVEDAKFKEEVKNLKYVVDGEEQLMGKTSTYVEVEEDVQRTCWSF